MPPVSPSPRFVSFEALAVSLRQNVGESTNRPSWRASSVAQAVGQTRRCSRRRVLALSTRARAGASRLAPRLRARLIWATHRPALATKLRRAGAPMSADEHLHEAAEWDTLLIFIPRKPSLL